MQIETYEIEEIKGELGVMAADSESIELIEKLGLDGQRSLSNTDTATRFPYPLMSPLEFRVYSLVFPEHEDIGSFRGGIIPLRVLQVAAFVRENPPAKFAGIKVWHTGIAKHDPLLVGHTEKYGGEFYLLARWGESLESFEALCEKAKKIWIAKASAKCRQEISQWQADLTNLDAASDELFASGKLTAGNKAWELENI